MLPRRRGRVGSAFVFSELAAALGILAILMSSVLGSLAFSRAALRRTERATAARYLADYQISQVRAAAAAGEPVPNVTEQELPPGLRSAERIPDLHCFVTIRDMDADHPGLKRVTVRITWQSDGRVPAETIRETLVMERVP
jgi:type II secretory pathway pseudopilin PulG